MLECPLSQTDTGLTIDIGQLQSSDKLFEQCPRNYFTVLFPMPSQSVHRETGLLINFTHLSALSVFIRLFKCLNIEAEAGLSYFVFENL